MLTIKAFLIHARVYKAPHLRLPVLARCRPHIHYHQHLPLRPLRRKPSEVNLRGMFYSQRISTKKRRLADQSAFDQPLRTRRPLSVQGDIWNETKDATEEAQGRKRSETHVEQPSTPFAQSSFDFRLENVVPEARRSEVQRVKMLKVVETPGPAEPSLTTKRNSVLLNFVHSLRSSLESDDEDEELTLDAQPQQKPDTTRNNSVVPAATSNPISTVFPEQRKRRRHSFHTSIPTIARNSLPQTRAEIQSMARECTMDAAEVSLHHEMHYQERYLSTHTRESETPSFRGVAANLARNRKHLYEYRCHKAGVSDLPKSVQSRMGRNEYDE